MKRKHVLILVFLLLFLSLGSYPFFPASPDTKAIPTPTASPAVIKNATTNLTVIRTKDGFSPQTLTISAGQSVTFIASGKDEFWPASDPHPVHSNLIGFDPGRAINAKGKFRFTFIKEGKWRYHDHLAPSFEGVIIVTNGNTPQTSDEAAQKGECEKLDMQERNKCWDEQIRLTIQKQGLQAAFKLFAYLYATQPVFVSQGCHWVAHQIGQEAYRQFAKGEEIVLSEQTSYCGYGFYHGFMQLLLAKNQNLKTAEKFCTDADTTLKTKAPLTRLNCFHGIGHGLVQDPPPPKQWGNAQAMVDPLIPKCLAISNNEVEKKECMDGIYNAVTLFKEAHQYGLALNRADPFGWCKKQQKGIPLRSCYYESSQKLDSISGWDVQKAAEFTKDITDEATAQTVMGVATAAMMQRDILREDNTPYILACRKVQKNLRMPCLRGVVSGYIAHGEPEKEYIKVLAFCKNPKMTNEEADLCYGTALGRLKNVYSRTKTKQVCSTVDEKYKKYCG